METALKAIVKKYNLAGEKLGEVALGAVMNHSADWNLARECVLGSGLSAYTPGLTVQQACGTGLAAAILMANKISCCFFSRTILADKISKKNFKKLLEIIPFVY